MSKRVDHLTLRGRVAIVGIGETGYYGHGGSPGPEFKLGSFEIINVMEIIGESMGLHAEGIYKRLKMMDDVDQMIAECHDRLCSMELIPTKRGISCWRTRKPVNRCRATSRSGPPELSKPVAAVSSVVGQEGKGGLLFCHW